MCKYNKKNIKTMLNINYSLDIKNLLPNLILGCISAEICNSQYNSELWNLIDDFIKLRTDFEISKIKEIPQIKSSREAYIKLGKEPSRYRLSAEALYRRILNKKGLYKINTAVDIINFSSLKTSYSIGGYDLDKIDGEILLRIGQKDDDYKAIGRGNFNVENLPVLSDNIDAFGSPTSDSERTSINISTKNILLVVFNFGNHHNFNEDLMFIHELIKKYLIIKQIDLFIRQ